MHVPPNRPSRRRWLLPLIALFAPGCMVHTHVVGLGATGAGEQQARQYYWLFGYVRVNEVDAQRLAPDLTSYEIESKFGFVDLLIAPFLLPFAATSRTVVVRT